MFQYSIKKLFPLISLLLITIASFSQTKYSSDQQYILSKKESSNFLSDNFQSAYPDTSITNIHNYTARNFSGNLGLVQPDYLLKYKSNPLGFKFYNLPYGNDIISLQNVEYFKTKGPFASLSGFAGSKQEQTFRLLFSHTTKKKLNITVKFNRFGSLGYYIKQQTFTNNFYSSINYSAPNKRFGFYSYLLFNKVKHQENGGIKYDTLIRDEPTIGKDLLAVNISNAKRENRLMDISINPWFKLNKGDSSKFSHYIDYKFNFAGNYYWYLDQGAGYDGFYSTFYLDTLKTNDSTHLRQFNNNFNYTLRLNKSGLGAKIGYSNEYTLLNQHRDSILLNQVIHSGLFFNKLLPGIDSAEINKNKLLHCELNYNNVFDGPNTTDSKIEFKAEIKLRVTENGFDTKRTTAVYLNVLSEQRKPDFIFNYIYANNFRWENKFKQVNLFQCNAGVVNYKSGLSADILWQNIGNYIYMDSTALPKQSNVVISNWAYSLKYNHVLFKHLGIKVNLTYQSTNKAVLMRIAPVQAIAALYYTGNLFKNNLQLQFGAQGEYYQAFKSYAYMPSYNMYYLQNRYTVGEYPFVDVFLNARIKPVQFFLKLENALYGLTGSNYNFVKGYMQPDRAFRFGLTWLFFD